MQNFTLPFRYPKIVPVIMDGDDDDVAVEEEDEECEFLGLRLNWGKFRGLFLLSFTVEKQDPP